MGNSRRRQDMREKKYFQSCWQASQSVGLLHKRRLEESSVMWITVCSDGAMRFWTSRGHVFMGKPHLGCLFDGRHRLILAGNRRSSTAGDELGWQCAPFVARVRKDERRRTKLVGALRPAR